MVKCVLCGKEGYHFGDECSSCRLKLKTDFEKGWMEGKRTQRSQNRRFGKSMNSLDDDMRSNQCPLCKKFYFGKNHDCDISSEFKIGFQSGRLAGFNE